MAFGNFQTNHKIWLDESLKNKDWQRLNDLIFKRHIVSYFPDVLVDMTIVKTLCRRFEALSCVDYDSVECILPFEFGFSKNGHPLLVTMSNILMAICYKNDEILPKILPEVRKFTNSKKP